MSGSNSQECFRECVGKRIKGILFGALPLTSPDIARRTKTFVFDDGTGLTISDNGSFWSEDPKDIRIAIHTKYVQLQKLTEDLKDCVELMGEKVDE